MWVQMGGGERGPGEIEMDGELLTVLDTLENEATVSGGFFTSLLRQAVTFTCLDQIAPLLYPLAHTHSVKTAEQTAIYPSSTCTFVGAFFSAELAECPHNNAIQLYHLVELSVICPLDSVFSHLSARSGGRAITSS